MAAELRLTPIDGVFELMSYPFVDSRGAFLNVFRGQEDSFRCVWGDRMISQVNISRSEMVGAIRGLHFQAPPYSETKLVRCLKGRVWDLAVDLRTGSPTYSQWHAVELSPELSNSLIIPEGCAHGFQVLEPESELLYLHSGVWKPEFEAGVRWDDPQLCINWPLMPTVFSQRDQNLPFLSEISYQF